MAIPDVRCPARHSRTAALSDVRFAVWGHRVCDLFYLTTAPNHEGNESEESLVEDIRGTLAVAFCGFRTYWGRGTVFIFKIYGNYMLKCFK